MNKPVKPGKVWLVGAGPGDPELLTIKAARALGEADVWLLDDLVSPEMLRYAAPHAEVIAVGKRGGRCSVSQERIHELTLAHALAGRCVARVKGGDPLLFGRGGEEAEMLRAHGIPVEVINGISSGMAAAQALGIALTHRDHCHGVTFITAHTRDDRSPDWHALAAGGTTLVIYMGMTRLAQIRDGLLTGGLPAETPAGVVMYASGPRERRWVGTLGTLAEALAAGLGSPAVVLVGGVVGGALPAVTAAPPSIAEALCTS